MCHTYATARRFRLRAKGTAHPKGSIQPGRRWRDAPLGRRLHPAPAHDCLQASRAGKGGAGACPPAGRGGGSCLAAAKQVPVVLPQQCLQPSSPGLLQQAAPPIRGLASHQLLPTLPRNGPAGWGSSLRGSGGTNARKTSWGGARAGAGAAAADGACLAQPVYGSGQRRLPPPAPGHTPVEVTWSPAT